MAVHVNSVGTTYCVGSRGFGKFFCHCSELQVNNRIFIQHTIRRTVRRISSLAFSILVWTVECREPHEILTLMCHPSSSAEFQGMLMPETKVTAVNDI